MQKVYCFEFRKNLDSQNKDSSGFKVSLLICLKENHKKGLRKEEDDEDVNCYNHFFGRGVGNGNSLWGGLEFLW